jgi:(2Fe-2S) ferredoxin
MPKLRSVDDLTHLREAKQRAMKVARSTGTTINVGMGTCGIAAGARETMQAIEDELARRKIEARIAIVGCIGMCVREPLIDIQQANTPRVTYANVTPQMIPRLIEEHLLKGRPVKEWVVGRLTVEEGGELGA